jgi:MFS transporter, ACS family, glucarate transporter
MSGQGTPKKRSIVLILLVLVSVITFLDRLAIAVAGPRMQDELGITPERWGWVLGAFVLTYGLFEIPTGAMGDRIGHRKVLTRIVAWWSAFTFLTGSVTGFVPLLITRLLFGVGEAGAYPNIAGVIARWFPPGERARAQGFIWGASRAGGALAPLIVLPIQEAFGWRVSFRILGAVGLVWAMVWYWWYRDEPAAQPGITDAELHEIGTRTGGLHGSAIPWRLLLRSRPLWLIMGMYSCYAWGSWFYFSWLHTYLVKGRGFSEKEMGFFSSLPFILGALANIGGGFLGDHLARRYGLRTGRRLVGSVSLTASALLLIATAVTPQRTMAVLFLTLGFGVMDLMLPTAWAICLDIAPKYAGAVTGAMNMSGQFGGFLCTVLFGYAVERSGSYHAPLFLIAFMLLCSAILFSRIDPTRPLVAEETREESRVDDEEGIVSTG